MQQDALHYNCFALHQTDNGYLVHTYCNATIKIINNINKTLETTLFFSKRNAFPLRNSMCFTEPQGTLPCSEKNYDNQSYQHQIGNSCFIFLILVFMSTSNPRGTAQSAQRLGYGLEYVQESYLFSKMSTQATSTTHSSIQFVPQALLLTVGSAQVSPFTSIY
jgi:hypothetical protein